MNVVLFCFVVVLFCFVRESLELTDWLNGHASKFPRFTQVLPSIFGVMDMLVQRSELRSSSLYHRHFTN